MKIVLSISLALFLVSCSNDATEKKVEKKVEKKAVVQKEAQKKEIVEEEDGISVVKSNHVVSKDISKNIQKAVGTTSTSKTEMAAGEALFLKCTACHGTEGEKSALNKSQIIQTWSAKKIEDALHGYKSGTYGGSMKGVMKSQVANLSDAEITEVAEYIATITK